MEVAVWENIPDIIIPIMNNFTAYLMLFLDPLQINIQTSSIVRAFDNHSIIQKTCGPKPSQVDDKTGWGISLTVATTVASEAVSLITANIQILL